MIVIDVGIFQIRIEKHGCYTWSIYLETVMLKQGQAITTGGARISALAALKNLCIKLEKDVDRLLTKTYQTSNVTAFRWDGDPRLQGIQNRYDTLRYNGTLINEGDWILPDIGICLKDPVFTKLFCSE